MKLYIRLHNFDKIIEFIKVADTLTYDLKLSSGNTVADGKSILGICALDLSNDIEVSVINDRQVATNYYPKELEGFMV